MVHSSCTFYLAIYEKLHSLAFFTNSCYLVLKQHSCLTEIWPWHWFKLFWAFYCQICVIEYRYWFSVLAVIVHVIHLFNYLLIYFVIVETKQQSTLLAYNIRKEFFTTEVLTEIGRQLVLRYFPLTETDLKCWQCDPESFS